MTLLGKGICIDCFPFDKEGHSTEPSFKIIRVRIRKGARVNMISMLADYSSAIQEQRQQQQQRQEIPSQRQPELMNISSSESLRGEGIDTIDHDADCQHKCPLAS